MSAITLIPVPGEPGGWLPAARDSLRAGGIVGVATETYYGLAADPADAGAVSRLLALKGHPAGRPILLLAAGVEQVAALCDIDAAPGAACLAAAFWPGPLTLVLPLRPGRTLPACPSGTVALRVPGLAVPRSLAAALGSPITGTSANPAGAAPPVTARQVADYFPVGLAMILDCGPAPGEEPSTLLDLSGAGPRLLRAGRVTRQALEAKLGRVIPDPAPDARP